MQFAGRAHKTVIGIVLAASLSACGGGSGTSESSFAQAVGLTPLPVPSTSPGGADPAPTPAAPATAAPVVWANARWVDFQNGNDNNTGTTKAAAWKHAPGDPAATGVAAAYKPAAGDQIVFAAGVRYFGNITAPFQGEAGSPVTLIGESIDQTAVIDGSSASATAQPCVSQSACYGVAAWRSVSIVKFANALPANAQLYSNGALLTPAQWPNPEDLFYNEEVTGLAEDSGTNLNAGMATVPASVLSLLKTVDDTRVAVWVQSNKIVERRMTGIKDGKVLFDNTGISTYIDRPSKFALRGHAAMIDMTGEYAILPDRKTVLVKALDPKAVVYASTGRGGIDLSGANHVTVKNLGFEHMSDVSGNVRSGLPVWAMSKAASNLRIENNRFEDLVLFQGNGAITLWDVTNATVSGNTIRRVAYGSGMRLLRNKNTLVFGNSIERVGRTGIMLMNNADTQVIKNRIRDIMGVHGNGFSAYLGNQRTKVIANTITEAYQPATYHGNGSTTPKAEDILFANNLFVGTNESLGALVSWGKDADKVTMVNNVLLGGNKGSLRLNALETNLTVRRNVIAGIILPVAPLASWKIESNAFTFLSQTQPKYFSSDAVTSALTDPVLYGKAPANLGKFCPYITELVDYTLVGQSYGRSIGAGFTCS